VGAARVGFPLADATIGPLITAAILFVLRGAPRSSTGCTGSCRNCFPARAKKSGPPPRPAPGWIRCGRVMWSAGSAGDWGRI
jgi:hypothetical protein